MTECEVVYCFVDTDVLVHFQTFDEVEWPAVANSPEVCLVLASTVMAELNGLKDRARDWRGKRARTLISKLKSVLKGVKPGQPVEIRSSVSLMDIPDEPIVDWDELGLDPSVNDDRVLAAIIVFAAQHPSRRAALVSNDFNALRKAQRHGISTIDPEESQVRRLERLPDEEAEIRRLKERIRELENRIPRLELAFLEDQTTKNVITRSVSIPQEKPLPMNGIRHQIEQKEEYLEEISNKARMLGVSDAEIQEFVKRYTKYVAELESVLVLKRTRDYELSCRLGFVLRNTGSALATDVELTLRLPSDSFVVGVSEIDSFYGEVFIPEEPRPKWRRRTSMGFPSMFTEALDPMSIVAPIPVSQPPEQPRPRGPLYSTDPLDRSIVWYETPKMRSMDSWHLEPIVVYLSPEIGDGFQVSYSVHADELPDYIDGHLSVKLQRE